MKIWFAANISKKSHGGVARSMRELARYLQNHGHDVTIVYRSPYINANYLLFALQVGVRLLIRSACAPDYVIARSTDGLACAVICRIFKLKTRIVLHNHGWEEHVYEYEKRLPNSIVTNPTTWKAKLVRFNLLRSTLKISDICMSGTIDEIRWLRLKYPQYKKKYACVPNGVSTQASAYWHRQPEKPLSFLCIGPPTWKKNIAYAIALFSAIYNRNPQARIYLIGTGVEDIHVLFSLAGLPHNSLIHVSRENPDTMSKWYTTCPNLLACSRYEGGHSFAILEALSYAMMVFASPIPSNKEIINNGHNGYLLSCTNAHTDAQMILTALADSSCADKIRHHAYQSSIRHAWPRQAKRLEKIL